MCLVTRFILHVYVCMSREVGVSWLRQAQPINRLILLSAGSPPSSPDRENVVTKHVPQPDLQHSDVTTENR